MSPSRLTHLFHLNARLRSWAANSLLVLLMLAGFGLRLIDLTDQPLDFHPARQLRAAIIARGMYAQMLSAQPDAPHWLASAETAGLSPLNYDPLQAQAAVEMWQGMAIYEPQILERLAALTYWLLGAELLWVARIYSALFWVLGGLALFMLARRATSYAGGALALTFYLFVPLGVIASRAFQPDPLMVALVLWAAYAAYRWSETRTWRWALLTGLFSGLAVLVKAPAFFQIGWLLIFTVLSGWGIKQAVRQPQVWAAGVLAALIPAAYYLLLKEDRSDGYLEFWSASFSAMLLEPGFYIRWLGFVQQNVVEISLFFAGLAGSLLFERRGKAIALGLWIGYACIGLTLPYLITTHDYYSLPLLPAIAFSLAPLAPPLIQVVHRQAKIWQAAFYAVLVLAVLYPAWIARSALVGQDYRQEALGWQALAQELPTDGRIIAITHDYGHRLRYYGWVSVSLWPTTADQALTGEQFDPAEFDRLFTGRTAGYDYFLITLPKELAAQPQLAEMLNNHYPLLADQGGYLLYDLTP